MIHSGKYSTWLSVLVLSVLLSFQFSLAVLLSSQFFCPPSSQFSFLSSQFSCPPSSLSFLVLPPLCSPVLSVLLSPQFSCPPSSLFSCPLSSLVPSVFLPSLLSVLSSLVLPLLSVLLSLSSGIGIDGKTATNGHINEFTQDAMVATISWLSTSVTFTWYVEY